MRVGGWGGVNELQKESCGYPIFEKIFKLIQHWGTYLFTNKWYNRDNSMKNKFGKIIEIISVKRLDWRDSFVKSFVNGIIKENAWLTNNTNIFWNKLW